MQVELSLDRRLRIPKRGIPCEFHVARFANSEHGQISHPFHNPEISFGHGNSVTQPGDLRQEKKSKSEFIERGNHCSE
jgi:hypothetical protein